MSIPQKPLLVSFGIFDASLLQGFVPVPEAHLANPVGDLEEARELCRNYCRSVIVVFQRDTKSDLGISNHLMQFDYTTTLAVPHISYSEGSGGRPPQMVEADGSYLLNSGCHSSRGRLKGGPITVLYVSNIDVLTNKVDRARNPGQNRSKKR